MRETELKNTSLKDAMMVHTNFTGAQNLTEGQLRLARGIFRVTMPEGNIVGEPIEDTSSELTTEEINLVEQIKANGGYIDISRLSEDNQEIALNLKAKGWLIPNLGRGKDGNYAETPINGLRLD